MSAVADGLPRQVVAGQHESLRRIAIRRFLRHRLAIVGVVILTTIVALAVFLPLFIPLDPLKTDYGAIRQPPGPEHILGADLSGRDIFARVVHGTRVSLIVGFGAVALYLVVGTTLGVIAGFSGGLRDQVVMRFTDVLLAIPLILLCIVFISIVGPGLASVIAVIGLLGWPHTTRIVRGQLLGAPRVGVHHGEPHHRYEQRRDRPASPDAEHPRPADGRGHVRGRPGDPARGVAVVPRPGRASAGPQPWRDDQRRDGAIDPPAACRGSGCRRGSSSPFSCCRSTSSVTACATRSIRARRVAVETGGRSPPDSLEVLPMLHAYVFGPIAVTVGYWVQRGVDTESGARVEIRRVEYDDIPGAPAGVAGLRLLPVSAGIWRADLFRDQDGNDHLSLPPALREGRRRRAVPRRSTDGGSGRLGHRSARPTCGACWSTAVRATSPTRCRMRRSPWRCRRSARRSSRRSIHRRERAPARATGRRARRSPGPRSRPMRR